MSLFRGKTQVVAEVSVHFEAGVTALLGPNGAGKTTLLEYLAGVGFARCQPQVLPASRRNARGVDQRNYGFMPQHWQGHPSMSVGECVAYAGWLKGMKWKAARAAAEEAIADVGLGDKSRIAIRKLSGGMRQRVGLAEALVHRPEFVLLDEPTVGLDPAQRIAFRDVLRRRGESAVIVLSTHLTEDVDAIADDVVVMSEGRIRFNGTLSALRHAVSSETEPGMSPTERAYLSVIDGPTTA